MVYEEAEALLQEMLAPLTAEQFLIRSEALASR